MSAREELSNVMDIAYTYQCGIQEYQRGLQITDGKLRQSVHGFNRLGRWVAFSPLLPTTKEINRCFVLR